MRHALKDPQIQEKMFKIAKHLDELNPKGEVKCRRQNNYGHAKVYQFIPGCSIWVHHMFNNTLLLDLLITPFAQNEPTDCNPAIKKFNSFFEIVPKTDENFLLPSRPDEKSWRQVTGAVGEALFISYPSSQEWSRPADVAPWSRSLC